MVFGFSKKEASFVSLFLIVIFTAIFFNLRIAERKSRDFQRKEDVNNITKIAEMFRDEYGVLPVSTADGKMLGCNPVKKLDDTFEFSVCNWGDEVLPGVRLPVDPKSAEGYAYRYISTAKHYQTFGSLESNTEPEFDQKIVARNLVCGSKVCNLARSSSNTPTDISLEEYESRLNLLNGE